MQDQIWRKKTVNGETGLSYTQIDRMEKAGLFPKRRLISERIVGWSANEVQAWINERLHGEKARL